MLYVYHRALTSPNFIRLLAGRLGEDIRKLILKIYDAFLSPDGKVLTQSLSFLSFYLFLPCTFDCIDIYEIDFLFPEANCYLDNK